MVMGRKRGRGVFWARNIHWMLDVDVRCRRMSSGSLLSP